MKKTMKTHRCSLPLVLGMLAIVGMIGCERGAPEGKAGATSAPATESSGQAIQSTVDGMVKTPLEKARQVGPTLDKAAERTSDAVKEAAP